MLSRFRAMHRISGRQNGIAMNERLQRVLKRRDIQRGADARRVKQVISGALGSKTVEKPQSSLPNRERNPLFLLTGLRLFTKQLGKQRPFLLRRKIGNSL